MGVRMAVGRNPSATEEVLLFIINNSHDRQLMLAVAQHPALPEGIIRRLIATGDGGIRYVLIGNPVMNESMLCLMIHDQDSRIREAVAMRLEQIRGG